MNLIGNLIRWTTLYMNTTLDKNAFFLVSGSWRTSQIELILVLKRINLWRKCLKTNKFIYSNFWERDIRIAGCRITTPRPWYPAHQLKFLLFIFMFLFTLRYDVSCYIFFCLSFYLKNKRKYFGEFIFLRYINAIYKFSTSLKNLHMYDCAKICAIV